MGKIYGFGRSSRPSTIAWCASGGGTHYVFTDSHQVVDSQASTSNAKRAPSSIGKCYRLVASFGDCRLAIGPRSWRFDRVSFRSRFFGTPNTRNNQGRLPFRTTIWKFSSCCTALPLRTLLFWRCTRIKWKASVSRLRMQTAPVGVFGQLRANKLYHKMSTLPSQQGEMLRHFPVRPMSETVHSMYFR